MFSNDERLDDLVAFADSPDNLGTAGTPRIQQRPLKTASGLQGVDRYP